MSNILKFNCRNKQLGNYSAEFITWPVQWNWPIDENLKIKKVKFICYASIDIMWKWIYCDDPSKC